MVRLVLSDDTVTTRSIKRRLVLCTYNDDLFNDTAPSLMLQLRLGSFSDAVATCSLLQQWRLVI
jgi:hypothetical protein